jgi:hypothetical protein
MTNKESPMGIRETNEKQINPRGDAKGGTSSIEIKECSRSTLHLLKKTLIQPSNQCLSHNGLIIQC